MAATPQLALTPEMVQSLKDLIENTSVCPPEGLTSYQPFVTRVAHVTDCAAHMAAKRVKGDCALPCHKAFARCVQDAVVAT